MDPRFLGLYERELKHVRHMGGEFAREFPKIAGRLGLDGFECADPYVERLMESFAFLAARVQLRLDAAFPEFTHQLLELLYPGYLAPTPSMTVVQLKPLSRDNLVARGAEVPRGSVLRSGAGYSRTACEFRTAHPVTLWPVELVSADYRGALGDFARRQLPAGTKSVLRIVLRTTGSMNFDRLALDDLPLFLRGGHEPAIRLYEHLLTSLHGFVALMPGAPPRVLDVVSERAVTAMGFDEDEGMLPCGDRSFSGHRLLQEYFAFPERFLFVRLRQLAKAVRACSAPELELLLAFNRIDEKLEGVVSAANLAPFCTPAVNLFPRLSDRVPLSDADHEHHVVPDRTRPLDLEVHSVTRVVGYGDADRVGREFFPLYAPSSLSSEQQDAYYSMRRELRVMSRREREQSPRSQYVPSEAYVSLVDGKHGPFRSDLKQLAVSTLCTNRTLPLQMSCGGGQTDFVELSGLPIEHIRCVAGPSPPRSSSAHGSLAWSLLGHLGLDYLAITRSGQAAGAEALRGLLAIHARGGDEADQKQIAGLLSVSAADVVRPLPIPGPLTFGRGVEVTLLCDELAFEGTSVFLLSAVLARYFVKYASINTFAETVLRTKQRGEVARWPTVPGSRRVL